MAGEARRGRALTAAGRAARDGERTLGATDGRMIRAGGAVRWIVGRLTPLGGAVR